MNFSKILNSKIALVLILCFIGYLSFSLNEKIVVKKESGKRVAGIKTEIEELTEKEAELLKLQDYYNSEDFLQKEARRILGYQKPGEEVYVLIPQKGTIERIEEKEEFVIIKKETKIDLSSASNPTKWWHFFFGSTD
jgi:cell division protein FtsB